MFRLVVPGLEACLTRRVGFPALGLSSILIQAMACYRIRVATHVTYPAGKFVTVIILSEPGEIRDMPQMQHPRRTHLHGGGVRGRQCFLKIHLMDSTIPAPSRVVWA